MSKGDSILQQLRAGWTTMPALAASTGWLPKTVSAFLSKATKKGVVIERQRVDGVLSYRIAAQ